MGNILPLIIFGVIILVNVLAARRKAAARQQRRQQQLGGAAAPQPQAKPQSSADLIQSFFEEMAETQGVKPPAPRVQPPQPAPAPQAGGVHSVFESQFRPEPPQPAPQPVAAKPVPEKKRRVASKKKRLAAVPAPAKAAKTAGPVLDAASLGLSGLRKAVIWSEILGPPVCMRPRMGHRPPGPGAQAR